jgi:hypothetical protein
MRGQQWAEAEEVPLDVFRATSESHEAAAAEHARHQAYRSLSPTLP